MDEERQTEILRRSEAVGRGVMDIDSAIDGLDEEESRFCLTMALYEVDRRKHERSGGQKRALQLLRSWLSPEQLAEYRRRGSFRFTGSVGGRYRAWPRGGAVELIERHGRRDWARRGFCHHEADVEEIPPADVVLANMLIIITDEPRFLAQANQRERWSLWSGEWRRQLNEARRRREAA